MRGLALVLALVAAPAAAVDSGYDLDIRLVGGSHQASLSAGQSAQLEVVIRPATVEQGLCSGVEIEPAVCHAFGFTLTWPAESLTLISFSEGEGIPQGWPTPTFSPGEGRLLIGAFSTGPALGADAVVLSFELEALSSEGSATISAIEIDFGDSGGHSICGAFDTPGDAGVIDDYWDELFESTLTLEPGEQSLGTYEPLPRLRQP